MPTFWEEHHRSEGNRAAAEAHQAPARTARRPRNVRALHRLPEALPEATCSVCNVNVTDLFGACLPCDLADGYLDPPPEAP